jgi:c-di-GMP-binding flagellar brake protein YcgR
MGIEDKRDTDRVPILGELNGEVKVYAPMSVREISRGGAQVETTFPLQLDSLHEFRLTLGEKSVVVKGRIAHCHVSDMDQELVTYRAGLEFIELSDRVQEAILEFIEAVKAGRRG